jgi:hypothetical protein
MSIVIGVEHGVVDNTDDVVGTLAEFLDFRLGEMLTDGVVDGVASLNNLPPLGIERLLFSNTPTILDDGLRKVKTMTVQEGDLLLRCAQSGSPLLKLLMIAPVCLMVSIRKFSS